MCFRNKDRTKTKFLWNPCHRRNFSVKALHAFKEHPWASARLPITHHPLVLVQIFKQKIAQMPKISRWHKVDKLVDLTFVSRRKANLASVEIYIATFINFLVPRHHHSSVVSLSPTIHNATISPLSKESQPSKLRQRRQGSHFKSIKPNHPFFSLGLQFGMEREVIKCKGGTVYYKGAMAPTKILQNTLL